MRFFKALLAIALVFLLTACGGKAVLPPVADTVPLILAPISNTTTADARGRFREIYCAVREDHGKTLPDDRPCDEALWKLAGETRGLGTAHRAGKTAAQPAGAGGARALQRLPRSDGLRVLRRPCPHGNSSGSRRATYPSRAGPAAPATRARSGTIFFLRPSSPARKPSSSATPRGPRTSWRPWSAYPEVRPRVAAVVSVAGAVGGSPLADELADFYQSLLMRLPAPHCPAGDGGGDGKPEAPRAPPLAVEEPASGGHPLLLAGELCRPGRHLGGPAAEIRSPCPHRHAQ